MLTCLVLFSDYSVYKNNGNSIAEKSVDFKIKYLNKAVEAVS